MSVIKVRRTLRWFGVGTAIVVAAIAGGVIHNAQATVSSGTRAVFAPITPCRLFDTRPAPDNVGPRTAPLAAGDTFTAQVTGHNGNCTVPAGATGVVMNVTIVNPTAPSFLTVFPADVGKPNSSNLNWTASSSPTPNQVTVLLSATGAAKFFNYAGTVDVLADVVGYYDDHNFDDRYYTKAEVDTKLASRPVAGFGQRAGVALYPVGVIEVATLTDGGGSGPVSLAVPSRVVVTGAVTVGNAAATGEFSIISCQLQMDGGSGFAPIGLPQGSESKGNNNHDETYNIALAAAVDSPAGTYDVRITCNETFASANSKPISRNASLTVIALPK